MARIAFRAVSKRYGDVTAVRDLDLEIRDKEFVVLLGPSGCGKTTTLHMIAGLEEVSAGELWFDDRIVNGLPPHRRDAAMVFQSYALYPHKSVYENIAFGLRMRRVERREIDRRVRAAAAKLEIAALLDRRPSQLSGGQRQRVALGRAMVREPAVFLMDEPLSNLDAALRISMRAEIKHLHTAMQTTFVYVTHDQAEALTLADRIVVMQDGVVEQIGSPDEVYERPRNMFVASFLGNPPINYLSGVLAVEGGTPVFRRGDLRVALPMAAISAAATGRAEVVLGIRPEDVAAAGAPGRPELRGLVDSVLPIGSDRFLGLKVEGADVFVRVDKQSHYREGETAAFGLVPERLHVFDRASGSSLRDIAAGAAT
ncbi:MAG TPA: sn-glycerol-3-phosphate ABC transporter ATP-binding protein UgpC [Xanthobacteraceae bacterium]|nr:sn-glycerol-3-phosphate ABC transporter ATP-binding protein UgpC [Xanthobacteraceae bacterium]